MSEQAPRSNPRLDNFEQNKVAYERVQFEDELYGEAGSTDFSDMARRRIEEADAYERHLESMAQRGEEYEAADDADYKDGVDRAIADSAELRRMDMMARSIAEANATLVTPENADRLPQVVKDKEDKLQELLIAFNENSTLPEPLKDAVIERIINATEQVAETEPGETTEKTKETTSDQSGNSEATANDATGEQDEADVAARENESLEEYEERHNVNPDLAIDPNEMPIAVPEMPGNNSEREQTREFAVGDNVWVRRTSGELENDWIIRDIGEVGDVTKVDVVKQTPKGLISKLIDLDDLRAMQSEGEATEAQPEAETADDETDHTDDAEREDDGLDEGEDIAGERQKSWFKRAKDAVNGGLTKLYFGIGRTMNKLASSERKEGETDEEYNERMKRNGRRAAVGIAAVAAAYGAYRLYHGIDGGSGGGAGGSNLEQPFDPTVDPSDLGPDTHNGGESMANSELLSDGAWNIPKGSGGEALMDRLGADKSIWYQHQDEFLQQFPDQAYRMPDGNVGFDDPGRLSKSAIEFWAQRIDK